MPSHGNLYILQGDGSTVKKVTVVTGVARSKTHDPSKSKGELMLSNQDLMEVGRLLFNKRRHLIWTLAAQKLCRFFPNVQ